MTFIEFENNVDLVKCYLTDSIISYFNEKKIPIMLDIERFNLFKKEYVITIFWSDSCGYRQTVDMDLLQKEDLGKNYAEHLFEIYNEIKSCERVSNV